ncbi:phosphate signaling complex protein PhoU [Motiliproteus sp. SC1-56]|uniref:phosphate signaling complex protein PhoU n=1 Tax=Motiliproteus sp. SC1-56 TaxID=2799565 RepID=UPI001A908D9A|nr:phosphate signaling complex protein PhoU [Motiliproteus sp. SC1-56]
MEFQKDAHTDHISRQFNEELEGIKSHLMTMGGIVEKQLQDAVTALLDGDSELAERARQSDKLINAWEVEIEEQCTQIIARRQPAASDLRLIMAVSRAVNDLERVGDEAARIAQQAAKLAAEGESPRGYSETRHISGLIREMLNGSLTAFARYDTDLAYKVAKMDRDVDDEYKSAMRALATYMMEDPRSISRILNIIWVLRSLERIGDHARNICQHLIYLVKGINVSHASLKEIKATLRD